MKPETVHGLLTPENCTVIFIDHQPQMSFGVTSIDRQTLVNNTVGLAKAAKVFNVPVILTTVETETFSGFMWPQITELFPGKTPIERKSMNSWEDRKFVAEVERIGRKKLVIAALWTEVCLAFPAIQAIEAGYEVYAVEDASGGTTLSATSAPCSGSFRPGRSRDLAASAPGVPEGLGEARHLRRRDGDRAGAQRGLRPGSRVRLHDGPQAAAVPDSSQGAVASTGGTDPWTTLAEPT